jgi:hypothetical protein
MTLRRRSTISALAAALWAASMLPTTEAGEPSPRRGDTDGDGVMNLTDAVALLGFLFLGGESPYCEPVADTNVDGRVDLADAVYILSFLFLGGPAPDALGDAERRL